MTASSSALPVVIVGQGYVGSTLAAACLRAGHRVHGVDRDPQVREASRQRFGDHDAYTVGGDVVPFEIAIIAVDTPLAADGQPSLDSMFAAVASVSGLLVDGGLVINESTVPPGTTDAVAELLATLTGLPANAVDVAFSPERIDPGNEMWTMTNTPKLVAGTGPRARERAAAFYRSLGVEVVEVGNVRDAEFAKLAENTFRAVGIALVNELSTVARHLGVDIRSALDAAATKPFGYIDFRPGIGVGGDCIPTDPHFLVHAAEKFVPEALPFLRGALSVNADMPHRVAARAVELLEHMPPDKATVLLIGLAHKRNHPDLTNAPSLTLARLLAERGVVVIAVDTHVDPDRVPRGIRLQGPGEPVEADLVIAVTVHDNLADMVRDMTAPILDTRAELVHEGVVRL